MPLYPPPERFDFRAPEEWPKWKESYKMFRTLHRLDKESQEYQVTSLLYLMGMPDSNEILDSFGLSEAEKKTFDVVLEKFTSYFLPKSNSSVQRSLFHQRNQHEGETIDEYVRALYSMAQSCIFRAKREQIRDRFLVGVRDTGLIERLALESDQDLDHLIGYAKKYEAVKKAVKDKTEDEKHADALRWSGPNTQNRQYNPRRAHMQNSPQKGKTSRQPEEHPQRNWTRNQNVQTSYGPNINDPRNQPQASSWRPTSGQMCYFCGGNHRLGRNNCPAYGHICEKCQKRNHFPQVCKSRVPQVAEVQEGAEADYEQVDPDAYLGLVEEAEEEEVENMNGDKDLQKEADKAELNAMEDEKTLAWSS